jgi:hypothetical protein
MKNLGFLAALRMTEEIGIISITKKWVSILSEELYQ